MKKKFDRQYSALGLQAPANEMDPREKAEIIFYAACKKKGIDPALRPAVHELEGKYQAPLTGLYELMVIRDAITENREADWNDAGEEKWGGWFLMNKPGFRFGVSLCVIVYSFTAGGSRLCTFDEEDQEFFMNECVAFWADFYGGKLPS